MSLAKFLLCRFTHSGSLVKSLNAQCHHLQLKAQIYHGSRVVFQKKKPKNLLLPLVEMFTKVRGQQAADAVI